MLILTRKKTEKIIIDRNITVEVLDIFPGGVVRLGITAPEKIKIDREEIHLRRIAEGWDKANTEEMATNE